MSSLPSFTVDEINAHNTSDSLWLIFRDKVYDVTSFQNDHPGGAEVLLSSAGGDAIGVFQDVGHSAAAVKTREEFLIGTVSSGPNNCQQWSESGVKWTLTIGGLAVIGLLFFAFKKYQTL